MNLENFVSETLTQIINGVAAAQKACEGTDARVNPVMAMTNKDKSIGQAQGAGGQPVDYFEFDIAVTTSATDGAEGGAGIMVGAIGIGGKAKSEENTSNESRIKFKVPVLLPRQGE